MHRLAMGYLTNLYIICCGTTINFIVRDQGQPFLRLNPLETSPLLTLSNLSRLHVRVGHLVWQRLHSILECATPGDLEQDSLQHRCGIKASCRSC